MENYHLYRIGMWLVARLPIAFVYFVAGMIGELNFALNPRSRQGVYANQRRVLPPEIGWYRRWRTARAAFRNFSYSVVDFFRVPLMTRESIMRLIGDVRGWEHLEAAQAAGKGGIIVTVHMGSWELGGAYLGLRGLPLTVAALPHRDPRIDRIFRQSREASGMEVVSVGGALRKLHEAVRHHRFIGLLADRDTRGHGPVMAFFGVPTHMPEGHARLALETGAWLIPGRIYRLHNWRLVIDFRPPVIPDPQKDTVESLTRQCIGYLEEFIRDKPEQWYSFYDLWDDAERPAAPQA